MKTFVKTLLIVLTAAIIIVGYNYLADTTTTTTTTNEGYAFSFENGKAKLDLNNKNNNVFSNCIVREDIVAGTIYKVSKITITNCFGTTTETTIEKIENVKNSQNFENNSLTVAGGILPSVYYTDAEGEIYTFYKNF